MGIENKKSDRYKELSKLIHSSLDKMAELKDKQQEDMVQFEESEQNAIEEKRKRLHYESIRIEENSKDIKTKKDRIHQKLQVIEDNVFEETRPIQTEKNLIDTNLEALAKEIEEIEILLERKKREKENLLIQRQKHEQEIDKTRSKFRDEILKHEKQLDKF